MTVTTLVAAGRTTARTVTTEAGFDALAEGWRDLEGEGTATVFQTFEWHRAWWRHFGEGNPALRLSIVVVEDEQGPAAICPLHVETVRVWGVGRLRILSFIGQGASDYSDILARPGSEARAVEALADHLATEPRAFDVIHCEDIPDRSATHGLFSDRLRAHGFQGSTFVNALCPRLDLGATWAETQGRMSGEHRRQLARKQRQLMERFSTEFELVTSVDDVPEAMEEFIRLHQRRWNGVGQRGVFADARVASFHGDVAARLAERGLLFLAFLKIGGKRVVVNYGFTYGGEFSYYLNGIGDAGEALKHSPGLVLHVLCIQEMVKRGMRVYDFLRGTEKYKYEMGATDRANWGLIHAPAGAAYAQRLFRLHMLTASARRRLGSEWRLAKHAGTVHGYFSPGFVRHIGARVRVVMGDGLTKARSPERSLDMAAGRRAAQ